MPQSLLILSQTFFSYPTCHYNLFQLSTFYQVSGWVLPCHSKTYFLARIRSLLLNVFYLLCQHYPCFIFLWTLLRCVISCTLLQIILHCYPSTWSPSNTKLLSYSPSSSALIPFLFSLLIPHLIFPISTLSYKITSLVLPVFDKVALAHYLHETGEPPAHRLH